MPAANRYLRDRFIPRPQRPVRAAIGRSGVLGHPDPRLTLLDNLQQYIGDLHGQLHRRPGHLLGDHGRRWSTGSGQITLGRDQIRSACPHRGSPPLPEDRAVNTLFRHESSPRGRRPLDARPLPRRHRPVTRAAAFRRGAATSADARKASSSARIPPGRHVPVNSTRRLRNSPDRCSPVASVLKWERRCREPDGPGTHTFAAPAAPGMSMTGKSTSWNKTTSLSSRPDSAPRAPRRRRCRALPRH